MKKLCFRLIDKTQQQIQALGTSDANGSASTDGSAGGKHAADSADAAAAAAAINESDDGGAQTADLSKLLPESAPHPDSMFIAKLLQADNKLIGRPFTQIEVMSLSSGSRLRGRISSLVKAVRHAQQDHRPLFHLH